MIPFVLGSASVLSPPQFGVPLAVASLGARGIQASIQNRKRRNASESGSPQGWQELGVGWNKESHGQVCWSRRTSRMTWGHVCVCWESCVCASAESIHQTRTTNMRVGGPRMERPDLYPE